MDVGDEGRRRLPPARSVRKTRRPRREERMARGKAARRAATRSSHGAWQAPPGRPDPVGLLESQATSRVPELVPIRYGRMLESPFTFFRGAALVMASDLSGTPDTGITVQCCGDAHLANFGLFGSPERQLLFDINDFDETLPGPWEWDVKRLAASFEIAGRDRSFSKEDRRDIVLGTVASYRRTLRKLTRHGSLDVWYSRMDLEPLLGWIRTEHDDRRTEKAGRVVLDAEKARSRDSLRAFRKLTTVVDGRLQFEADPPLLVPLRDLGLSEAAREQTQGAVRRLVKRYRKSLAGAHHPLEEFRYVDMARKVVGVGSVGTRAWVFLMLGVDEGDPLILQAKEAQASVLERFVGRSAYGNHGHRVVAGQRLLQTASDIFLGWLRVTDIDGMKRDYYLRQLHDWKGSAHLDSLQVASATTYGAMCGEALARAHARSGDWIALASYLGKSDRFDRAVADFSAAYADQNERDHEALVGAVRSGRVTAHTGL